MTPLIAVWIFLLAAPISLILFLKFLEDEFSEGLSPAIETPDTIYFFDRGMLTAFDATTGTPRWRVTSVGIRSVQVDASGKWDRPVVTEIVPATEFYRAEDYHQDFLQKHPRGYTCHYLRD